MTMLAVPSIIDSPPATGRAALSALSPSGPSATGLDVPVLAGAGTPEDAQSPTDHLLRARACLPVGDPARARLRTRAIEESLPLAYRLAGRYSGRGELSEDLRQVAALALVKAVDGYDPDRLIPFVGYAIPTIIGALKRHFRDTAWGMRVPRSTQELILGLPAAVNHLTQLHSRTPTSVELAENLRVGVDALLAAVTASQVYRMLSLNEPALGYETAERIDLIGVIDPHYSSIDDHLALGSLVAALPPRERRILTMRFYDEMTQERIAAEIGVSQMHVSRLLRQALALLRVSLLASASGAT